ncbi:MAG: hypothetical protein QM652_13180 [Legionella sp.]|uniref:hypothetical protein n=1 Tax=Legionella sp. TaxID=459 RepID=UPI0039E6E528
MIVQRIIGFTQDERFNNNDDDSQLIKSISDRFINQNLNKQLDVNDLKFLEECFKIRWDYICGKELDYTLHESPINNLWVQLAKQVAKELNVPYLKILFYNLTNDLDPRDGSKLTETVTLANFYVNDKNHQLLRKRTFVTFMEMHGFRLVTACKPGPNELELESVSIQELSRLRRCVQVDGRFWIEENGKKNPYTNFWSYLGQEIFPRLVKRNSAKMPVELLPCLLVVVESYYRMKEKKSCFSEFSKITKSFFEQRLQETKVDDVNYLYGQTVSYFPRNLNTKVTETYYLLHVFIAINDARDYELECEMEALSIFLFRYDRTLRVQRPELERVYKQQMMLSEYRKRANSYAKYDAYRFCQSILVSLYITQFQPSLFCGKKIRVWDIENNIPNGLYSLRPISNLLNLSNEPDYQELYGQIIVNFKSMINNKNWLTLFIRNNTTSIWLKKIENLQLSEVHGYWFEPESILAALLIFKSQKIGTNTKNNLNAFIDNFLITYAHKNELPCIKQLRVNIFFSQLLSNLDYAQRRYLTVLIQILDIDNARGNFLENCRLILNRRLADQGYNCTNMKFVNLDEFIVPKKNDEVCDVADLIKYYNNEKNLPLDHLPELLQNRFRDYLNELDSPIFSAEKRKQIEDKADISYPATYF